MFPNNNSFNNFQIQTPSLFSMLGKSKKFNKNDLNDDMNYNLVSSRLSKRHTSTLDFTTPRVTSVFCENCGLQYNSIQSLKSHQLYYCLGRDLSLNKSLLRVRNNTAVRLANFSIPSTNFTSQFGLNKITDTTLNSQLPVNEELNKFQTLPIIEPAKKNSQKITPKPVGKTKKPTSIQSNLKVYVLRLKPNQDLNKELENFVRENNLKAAFVLTCVGSLTKASLRMAYSGMKKNEIKYLREHLEILSLSGTLSAAGGNNLHISLANKDGEVFGGHVHGELNVFTTAEVVIGDCSDLVFTREHDYQSGFKELIVKSKK